MAARILIRPMLTAGLITILVLASLPGAASPSMPPVASNLVELPAEPGSRVLTNAPTMQAVVVDLDGDGTREIVALSTAEDGSVAVEAWAERFGAWVRAGPPLPVPLGRPEAGPMRLIVRRTLDGERVTLAREPLALDGDDDPCCLDLEDIVLRGGRIVLAPVAEPADRVDALFAMDLDGDGVDELVGSRSLEPLGDVSYPTAVSIHRWEGDAFAPSLALQLPVGSGDTPFILGDTDDVPGEELGILATIGRSELHRVAFDGARTMRVDDARLVPLPTDVQAGPVAGGRGLVVLSPDGVLSVRSWPANEPVGQSIARTMTRFAGSIIGTIEVADRPFVVLRQATGTDALHLRDLPTLRVPPATISPIAPAAPTFGGTAVVPYVGPLLGGGVDGAAAVIVAGRLAGGSTRPDATSAGRIGLLAGAAPIGLAGSDRGWLAVHHLPAGAPMDPSGGRMDALRAMQGSGLTVTPIEVAFSPERDDTTVTPATSGAIVGDEGELRVGPAGFRAVIAAPPGSRVHVAGLDPTVVASVQIVGPDGRAEVPMLPPVTGIPNPRYRAGLTVTTPAGHSYVASWEVHVTTEPPPVQAAATTPLGSGSVVVKGVTDAGSDVSVGGQRIAVGVDGGFVASVPVPPWPTDVVVEATGPFGARSREVLSVVGFLDYRSLPWIPIATGFVGALALILAVRIPRQAPAHRRADDDAALEEIDAD